MLTVPQGIYDIIASPPGSSGVQAASVPWPLTSTGDRSLDIVLAPSGVTTLSGHLTDLQGAPLAEPLLSPSGRNRAATTRLPTDASGAYSFLLAPGTIGSIWVEGGNWWLGPDNGLPLAVPVAGDTVLDLAVPLHQVDVRVEDSAGDPVSGASVRAYTGDPQPAPHDLRDGRLEGYSDWGLGTTRRGRPGRGAPADERLPAVPLHRHAACRRHALRQDDRSCWITVEGDRSLTITLQEPVTLSGHLTDLQGASHSGERLSFSVWTESEAAHTTLPTDASGAWTPSCSRRARSEQHLGGGRQLVARGSAYNGLPLAVPVAGDTVLDLAVPLHQVDVRVEDSAGDPVSGASVRAYTGDPQPAPHDLRDGHLRATRTGDWHYEDAAGRVGGRLLTSVSQPYRFTVTPPAGDTRFAKTTVSGSRWRGTVP